MANKKKKGAEKPQREMTRRHLAMWQREKRRQRIIFYGGIFIIAAIVLIILGGWFTSEYRPLHQTVIRVNDTEFSMSYYIDALKVGGSGQSTDIQSLANSVVKEIEQSELIKQGASGLGISVSDDEAREKLKGIKIPVNNASLDFVRTQMLQDRLYKEYFESQVPKLAAQVHINTMFLESENQASEIRTRLQNSENFTALAEKYSLDSYSKSNKGDVGWHTKDILDLLLGSSLPGDYAFGSEVGTLSQPRYDQEKSKQLGYWLIKVLEKQGETDAQVQGVLLGSEQEAQDVRAKLESGSDLVTLAKELSQNEKSKQNGGELGVVNKGEISTAFDGFVFSSEVQPGTWSQPVSDNTVSTKGGYWLIKVSDKAYDRQLETNDRNYLMAKAFSDWVSSLWVAAAGNVDDSNLDDARKAWAEARAAKG